MEQLELSYGLINKNSGGCGATSGTVWPVDRHLLTALLGFDELLEVTSDREASQDHTMHLLFSPGNIVNTLGKVTMDIEIWGLEEIDMVRVDRSPAGASSMRPQKCHNGGHTESLRNKISDLLGTVTSGMFATKAEPHGDVVAMWAFPNRAFQALAGAKAIIRTFGVAIENLHTRKETMLEHVRQGYSCMTEVVVHMVKELGYGGRRSHRICAHLVRMARDRNIPAPELTGEMLDEAARLCDEEPPGLDTATLQRCLDPVAFIESHNNTGGPAPSETKRMLSARQQRIQDARGRQQARRRRVKQGEELLAEEVAAVVKDVE